MERARLKPAARTAVALSIAVAVLATAATASAREFRSPDGKIYCYFSQTEPVTGCMTGKGSKFRFVGGSPVGSSDWEFDWSRSWYSTKRTPARGGLLRVGQSVRYLSAGPSRGYMGITCTAIAPRQVTCWETAEGTWTEGAAAGQPVSGFTMFSRCGRPNASFDPPTLTPVTPCSEVPGTGPRES